MRMHEFYIFPEEIIIVPMNPLVLFIYSQEMPENLGEWDMLSL